MTRPTLRLAAANGLYSAMQLLLVMYVGYAMGAAGIGALSLAQAVVTPLAILVSMNLRATIATDRWALQSLARYWRFRRISIVVFASAVGIALFCIQDAAVKWTLFALAIGRSFELLSDLMQGALLAAGEIGSVALSRIAASLGMVSAALVVWFTAAHLQNPPLALFASPLAVASLASLLLVDWHAYRRLTSSHIEMTSMVINFDTRSAVTGSFVAGADTAIVAAPRFVLELTANTEEVGIFAGATSLLMIGGVYVSSLASSQARQISDAWAGTRWRALFRSLALRSLYPVPLYLAVSLIGGDRAGVALFGRDFRSTHDLFLYAGLISLAWYPSVIASYFLFAARSVLAQATSSCGALLIALCVTYATGPAYGWRGASMAIAIAYAVRLLGGYVGLIGLASKRDVL